MSENLRGPEPQGRLAQLIRLPGDRPSTEPGAARTAPQTSARRGNPRQEVALPDVAGEGGRGRRRGRTGRAAAA